MRFYCILTAALLAAVAGSSAAVAQEGEAADFATEFSAQLEEWLPGMAAEKIPERRDSQQKLQEVCFKLGSPGNEADRAIACGILAATLGKPLPVPTRIWLIKQLEYLGGEECVDAVAKSLDDADEKVRDAARRALAKNSAAAANARLLAKLPGSSGAWRVGLINALGFRGDASSVGPLAALLGADDPAAVAAAANALAKIGGGQACGALKAVWPKASKAAQVAVADAYLRCADALLAAGKKQEALAIYNELAGENAPRVIRIAAAVGKEKAGR